MQILGIETSCDETAVAIIENGTKVLSNIVSSSQQEFETLGGVVPEDAARKQVECMIPVLNQAFLEAKISINDIDAIAITKGPGLLGSLLVGTSCARLLSTLHTLPLIPVHHTFGHLSSTWLERETAPEFPCMTLSVSGGHTDLWHRTSHGAGELIGRTIDDAAGEAFDKGAMQLGLPYPGGPAISALAETGKPHTYTFPKPLAGKEGYNYSFSGLKTALKYLLRDEKIDPIQASDPRLPNVAASYQHALCSHLKDQVLRALKQYQNVKAVHIVGGVSANRYLRQLLEESLDIPVLWPTNIRYCTDNAAMIAAGGYFWYQEKGESVFDSSFQTQATLDLCSAITRA